MAGLACCRIAFQNAQIGHACGHHVAGTTRETSSRRRFPPGIRIVSSTPSASSRSRLREPMATARAMHDNGRSRCRRSWNSRTRPGFRTRACRAQGKLQLKNTSASAHRPQPPGSCRTAERSYLVSPRTRGALFTKRRSTRSTRCLAVLDASKNRTICSGFVVEAAGSRHASY
jgi:hypothetical protein